MSKRKHDGDDEKTAKVGPGEVDLVYPFAYQSSSACQLTPPFLNPSGPLYTSNGLLSVRVTSPITITNSNGIGLNYDDTQFTVTDGKLQLLSITKMPLTVAVRNAGSRDLSVVSGTISNEDNNVFKCSYWIEQTNVMGMLTTCVYVKLDTTTMGTRPGGATNIDARYFTFWISTFISNCNPSTIEAGTIEPQQADISSFEPATNPTNPPNFAPSTADPYFQAGHGYVISTYPGLTGNVATGTINVRMLPTTVTGTDNVNHNCIAYTYQCTKSGLFNPSQNGSVSVGPVTFTCPAARLPQLTTP